MLFFGRCRRGYLKFPSLGSTRVGKVKKNTHWKDPRWKSWPWTARAADGAIFSTIFGSLSLRRYWNGILRHFGKLHALENRRKMKKKIVWIAIFWEVFRCQGIENIAKTSVLDRRYGEKTVNYRFWTGNIVKTLWKTMFWKDCKKNCNYIM